MIKSFRHGFRSAVVIFLLLASAVLTADAAVRFKVNLGAPTALMGGTVSGRLLIFMTRQTKPLTIIDPEFTDPNAVWITAKEINAPATPKSGSTRMKCLFRPGFLRRRRENIR